MNRRSFIRLAGGGVVVAAAGLAGWQYASRNVFPVPETALAAWAEAGQAQDLGRFVLSYAVLAPNSHNKQPWIADLSVEGEIGLSMDTDRLLPKTDPFNRQMMMGLGTFLELLVQAAAVRGHRADIVLFPEGVPGEHIDSRRMVTVRLIPDANVTVDPLFAAAPDRRTDRRAYDLGQTVTSDEIAALIAAAAPFPLRAGVETDAARVARIRDIANRAWRHEILTERTLMESMEVLRVGTAEIDRHRDGLVIDDPMVVMLERFGLFDRTTPPAPDSMAITAQLDDFAAITAATPAYLWIVTEGNSRAQQIEAGRAYVRMNLAGTALGLSMHPNQQSLQEYPEVASEYTAIHQALNAPAPQFTVQMLARLGRVPQGSAPLRPSPRRGVEAQLA
ncbi:MAG: twin-arginine translocation pathway signal protein [Cypionkella sp.]|nr:twin-arginine translocation pathway signal protein [Cypionkella sp.]